MNITVLGAGLVVRAIVKDLAQDAAFHVTVVDINPRQTQYPPDGNRR